MVVVLNVHDAGTAMQSSREDTMRAITLLQPALPEWLTPGTIDFIKCALQKQVHQRHSIGQLLQHPWVQAHARWGGHCMRRAPSHACGVQVAWKQRCAAAMMIACVTCYW